MLISLFVLPIITLYLSPEAFGIIALFSAESAFLTGIYGLGLHTFAGRMIFKYDRRNKKTCKQYLGVILFYRILFSLIGLFISLPFVKILKNLILKDVILPNPLLLYIPAAFAFFSSIYGFTTNSFLNFQQNKFFFL